MSTQLVNDKFAALRARIVANMAAAEEKKRLKGRVKQIVSNGMKAIPRAKDEEADARLATLEAENQWSTHGILITGQIQCCTGCGHRVLATTGVFNIQQHKHFNAKRLRATQTPDMSLPVSRALDPDDFMTPVCANCALDETDPLLAMLEATAAHTAHFVRNQLSLF